MSGVSGQIEAYGEHGGHGGRWDRGAATWEIPVSVAPMMQRTDRDFRYMMRLITRHTLLWSEMITAKAVIHGDAERLLAFSPEEGPLVLQLGGDDPEEMARAAQIAAPFGYHEVNINVGCPSSRVGNGGFGACLMARPERVAECVVAMREAVDLPITVKHRIGIDEIDRYEDMLRFVDVVAEAGACARFTVHARKAWLQGLSPHENRTIPPLRYEEVYRLKRERPELIIEINGGITSLEAMQAHLEQVDAVMLGRAAYDEPYLFAAVDGAIFGDDAPPRTRHEVVEAMVPYVRRRMDEGVALHWITRHMMGLFAGQRGAKRWRRVLGGEHHLETADERLLIKALEQMPAPR